MDTNSIELEEYISQHIDAEDQLLIELDRYTHLKVLRPRMLSGHQQGTLMKMLIRMANPKLVLEIGTFTGYSALSMAAGLLRNDAHIHTIEIDDEMQPIIEKFFSKSKYADKLTLHIGDVANIIDTIDGNFDFVFIDGNKRNYVDYYNLVMDRLAHGGYILADNILWDGKVVQKVERNDTQTQGILDFNNVVAKDNRVEKVILPIRDGLSLIRKI